MYPIPESRIQEAVDKGKAEYKQEGGDVDELRVVKYIRSFYKESDDTPQNWNGTFDTSKEGPAYSHNQDIIAEIEWKDGEWKESTLYWPLRFYY